MEPDAKVRWFIVTGEAILNDLNMPGATFFVQHIIRDNSFRVMIEKGKEKQGFAVPSRMKLKDYEELFAENASKLKKKVSGYSGKGLLSI